MNLTDYDHIASALKYSEQRISRLEQRFAEQPAISECSVVVVGSYARKEAEALSDCDFFVIAPKKEGSAKVLSAVRAIVEEEVGKLPSAEGSFNEVEVRGELGGQIGGQDDTNDLITRRILFLTEGACLSGKELFADERDRLLNRYIRPEITDHQLALFFLNDVIRFYRTMCVDFEYKTSDIGKAYGIRNIKLVFSRKLLYFGGVIIAAETWQKPYQDKIEAAKRLMAMTPLERIVDVCGNTAEKVLREYDFFLGELSNPDVRSVLENVSRDEVRSSLIFKSLKSRGHHFSIHLMGLLRQTYPEGHAIHRALLM